MAKGVARIMYVCRRNRFQPLPLLGRVNNFRHRSQINSEASVVCCVAEEELTFVRSVNKIRELPDLMSAKFSPLPTLSAFVSYLY